LFQSYAFSHHKQLYSPLMQISRPQVQGQDHRWKLYL
jgi:hypothetical protein